MESLRTPDGIELHTQRWTVADGTPRRGSVLLVHGLGEHSGRYAHVAAALNEIGLDVTAYDQRGHGRSGGPRGGLPHSEALVDDLRQVFDALATEDPAWAPPFLLGHSMGGAIAARAATAGLVTPRGLILTSPALAATLSPVQRAMALVARRLIPNRPVANGLPIDVLSHDPAIVAAYKADPAVHDRISARLFDAIIAAGAAARTDASRLRVPTLGLIAGRDRFVDAAGSRAFFAALPKGVGTLHVYDDLYHEVFNEREPDRSRVLGDLRAWLEAQLAATARSSSTGGSKRKA
jgi:alpha-beta hydrolase superfamily lysophospholipase